MDVLVKILIAGFVMLVLAFFGWFLVWLPIRTGSAGYSGISIERKYNPKKFWLTVISNILGILFVFGILIISLVRNQIK